jgi:glycosyltransferase involved in cell wall biosynthesis
VNPVVPGRVTIGIIALHFNPGRTGGSETYFRNLIRSLQRLDNENQYLIFVPKELADSLSLNAPNFTAVGMPGLSHVLGARLKRRALAQVASRRLAAIINAHALDVAHFPFGTVFPEGVSAAKVLTVHDLQHEFLPDLFSRRELRRRRISYRTSISTADAVLAVSDFTRQTILDAYRIPPDAVAVIHQGYDEGLFAPASAGEPDSYFFYPAATWPHKNHRRLLEAFSIVNAERPHFRLVLSGMAKQEDTQVSAQIRLLGLEKVVRRVGYVADEQLPALYGRAYAMVFPSLFEGFGIPLLEAMACGCPVITSNVTSIPEVAGDAALYFDPLDPVDIASKMLMVIDEQSVRGDLARRGALRVRRFSSDAVGRATLDALVKAAYQTPIPTNRAQASLLRRLISRVGCPSGR